MGQNASQLKLTDIFQLRNQTLFTEAEIKDFYKDFKKKHPSGRISEADLHKLYKKIFPNGDPSSLVAQIFRIYDTDHNGYIDFREFLCVLSVVSNGPSTAKLKLAFDLYDQDGSGFISRDEFQQILLAIHKAAGEMTKSNDPVQQGGVTFERMDSNRDNMVSFDEFEDFSKHDRTLMGLLSYAGDI